MRPLGAVGVTVCAYLAVFGALLWWRLSGDVGDGILCAAPVALAMALAVTSQADRRQYVARLFAAALFLPAVLMMWASSHGQAGLWLIAFALGHACGCVAFVVWLASFTTRIDAASGAAPVGGDILRRRLASLSASLGPAVAMRDAGPAAWLFDLTAQDAEKRTHRVLLELDEPRRAVAVREFVGVSGAAPRTEHEASMRGPGDAWFDPSRPEARAIWTRTWQATMIEPDRLRSAALQFDLDRVERAPQANAVPLDGEALVTLLAALVTCSGYAWRPRLLPGR